MVGQMKHYRWHDLPSEPMNAATERRYINSDRVTLARFELKRGGVVPRHSHENEQVSYIVSGALRFKVGGEEVVVRGGEVIQIPSWVEHEVDILEDTIAIDVFSPVRQDWINKTDNYFNVNG
jgi:quercetin dioxygenase-like cupin family protein